jgi:hypothetical protein
MLHISFTLLLFDVGNWADVESSAALFCRGAALGHATTTMGGLRAQAADGTGWHHVTCKPIMIYHPLSQLVISCHPYTCVGTVPPVAPV